MGSGSGRAIPCEAELHLPCTPQAPARLLAGNSGWVSLGARQIGAVGGLWLRRGEAHAYGPAKPAGACLCRARA